MQAYQTAPCPYCGATWNPPGAQACTNCHNQLPPAQPTYAPPGYAPQQGQPPQAPGQDQGFPYGNQNYPQQPGYPQAPTAYPAAPQGYPGTPQPGQPYAQPGAPYQGQQSAGQYPSYAPPGYGQPPAYGGYPGAPGYPGYPAGGPGTAQSGTTTLRLFGQTLTVPVVLPPAVVRYQQQIAYGVVGFVVLLILLFGVLPAFAAGQITSGNQAIAAAVSHQLKVDAGFAAFFTPDTSSTDLNVLKTEQTKTGQSISDALTIVQADESALSGVDQRLGILSVVAIPSRAAIAAERQSIASALDGLKSADTALTAGSNLSKALLPMYDAKIDYAKMSNALNKHDLVGAAAPYPDAQQKVQQAVAASQAPGVPPVIANEASTLSTLLDNTESLIQAIQNKDAAGVTKYSSAIQAGLKTMAGLSLAGNYEVKTYGASQKAYDAAMKALKA